ncbi:MAG: hypothetical protein IKI02_09950 [Oscillospiraceae bacterium]|nr:hypothetical protein [Oscillospiraceae bacterium]
MKLFEEQEPGKEAAAPEKTAAAPDQLILNIEGLSKEQEPEPLPALKAETKELPDQREVLLAALRANLEDDGEQPADETAEAQNPADANEAAESGVEPQAAEAAPDAEEPRDEAANEPEKAPLSALSYQSVAKAVVDVNKEPTGRFDRDAVDDETLLAELYALIGRSGAATKPEAQTAELPADSEEPAVPKPTPISHPAARITEDDLQTTPLEYEALPEDDSNGVPGWLKGAFLLLFSLLLSAMTFYAVASDLLGKVF